MKIIFTLIITAICLILALLPEGGLYLLYHLIAPTTETSRIITLVSFLFFGGGLCVGMGFIAFALWVSLMKVVLE